MVTAHERHWQRRPNQALALNRHALFAFGSLGDLGILGVGVRVNVASIPDAFEFGMVIWGSAFHCDPQLVSANLDGSKPEEIVTVEASPGTYCQVSDRRFRFSTSSHLEAPGDPGQESLSIATAVAHPLLAVQCCLRKTKLSGEEYDAIETLTA
jgi:hypothetical protein